MPDPLDVLRSPAPPVDPDPDFTRRLRARLARALELPKGVTVSDLTTDLTPPPARTAATTPDPEGVRHGDIGYVSLWVADLEQAATFFSHVLGWHVEGRRVHGLSLHHGLWDGEPRHTIFCAFAVEDVDAAVERVRAAGGTAGEPHDEPYGRLSDCEDDQGVPFALYQPPGGTGGTGPAPNGIRQGDVAYLTMEVPDAGRTRAFYGTVLGWGFEPGATPDGWHVAGAAPMVGISGGHETATTVPMYRVDDIEQAVGRVREAGGAATDPETHPYGTTSNCTDDQGTRFYLGQL